MISFRFYLITDGSTTEDQINDPGWSFARAEKLLGTLLGLIEGGLKALQVREKTLSPLALTGLCDHLTTSLEQGRDKVRLYLNDRADLALGLGFQGVHLREDSLPLHRQSPILRDRLSFGVSTHSLAGVQAAQQAGADFVTFGPVYPTASKRAYGDPVGLKALAEVCRECRVPVLALGGVTPDRAKECREAGAYGVAAISSIWDAPDPVEALHAFEEALGGL